MNADRMYSLAVAAVLCCTPAFAQLGTSSPGAQTGAQTSPNVTNDPGRQSTNPQGNQSGYDNQTAQTVSAPAQDKMFVKKALQGSMAEVELGQLAQQKSSDDQVKQFGQKMVDDHTKMIDQMKPVAQQLGVEIPSTPSKAQMKTKEKLQALSGSAFDHAYIKDMVKDHKEDDADFKREAGMTQNPQLKELVQQGDQVISSHLQMIQDIAKQKGTGTSKTSSGQ